MIPKKPVLKTQRNYCKTPLSGTCGIYCLLNDKLIDTTPINGHLSDFHVGFGYLNHKHLSAHCAFQITTHHTSNTANHIGLCQGIRLSVPPTYQTLIMTSQYRWVYCAVDRAKWRAQKVTAICKVLDKKRGSVLGNICVPNTTACRWTPKYQPSLYEVQPTWTIKEIKTSAEKLWSASVSNVAFFLWSRSPSQKKK